MSDTSTTVAAAPAAPTPAAPSPAPEAAPVTAATFDIDAISPEMRRALSLGEVPATVTPEAPSGAQPVVPDIQTPGAPAPAADATTATPAEEEPAPLTPEEEQFTRNFRIHTTDKKASAFMKAYRAALEANPDANPAVIAAGIGYDLPVETATPAAPTPGAPAPEIPGNTPVDALKAEIAQIDAQLDEHGANEGLVNGDIMKLLQQRSEKAADLRVEQMRAENIQSRARDQRLTARQQVKAQVLQDYPTANDDTSLLGKEIKLLLGDVQADPNHPLAAKMADDNFPAILTAQAVKNKVAELQSLGLTEAQATAAVKGKPIAEATSPAPATPQPQKTTPAPVPRNALVTNPGGKAAPAVATPTAAQVLEMAESNPKLRRTLLFGSGEVTLG